MRQGALAIGLFLLVTVLLTSVAAIGAPTSATEQVTEIQTRVFHGAAKGPIRLRIYEDGSARLRYTATFPGHKPVRVGCSNGVPW